MNSNPLVSIITPVYNGEKYLRECIESVLNQTYENWEYVIVNNRSTDKTLDIANYYAEKDKRIRIHNNEKFLPIIENWNNALCQMSKTSKYCKMLHADDELFPECIEKMVELAEKYDSVGIVGAYRLVDTKVVSDGLEHTKVVFSGKEICHLSLMNSIYVFGSPTTTMIRSDIIRASDKFYNEVNYHADTEACYKHLQNWDFGFVHQVLTFTRVHPDQESTFARKYDTGLSASLAMLIKYGPIYLSHETFRTRLKEFLTRYYLHIAYKLIRFEDRRGYIEWHTKALREVAGYSFSKSKLFMALSYQILGYIVNPGSTMKRLFRKIVRE